MVVVQSSSGDDCATTVEPGMCWERIPASWGALPGLLNMWYPTVLSVEGPGRPFGWPGTAPKRFDSADHAGSTCFKRRLDFMTQQKLAAGGHPDAFFTAGLAAA